jgi:hypothetical protein
LEGAAASSGLGNQREEETGVSRRPVSVGEGKSAPAMRAHRTAARVVDSAGGFKRRQRSAPATGRRFGGDLRGGEEGEARRMRSTPTTPTEARRSLPTEKTAALGPSRSGPSAFIRAHGPSGRTGRPAWPNRSRRRPTQRMTQIPKSVFRGRKIARQ